MPKPSQEIVSFLRENDILTIATSVESQPYCAICFYVYSEETNSLIFASKTDTKHIQCAKVNPRVAGTVYKHPSLIKNIQGIQFEGNQSLLEGTNLKSERKLYYNAFPSAKLISSSLWKIDLDFLKMTNNKLGFGNKEIWVK